MASAQSALRNSAGNKIHNADTKHEDNQKAVESMWIGSLSVDDVDRAAAAVYKHGGTVLDEPLDAFD